MEVFQESTTSLLRADLKSEINLYRLFLSIEKEKSYG